MRQLLTIAMLGASALTWAQQSTDWHLPFTMEEQPVLSTDGTAATAERAPHRSAADGVYYQRPEGAYYQGMRPATWQNYPVTKIVVRPWQPVTYRNLCTSAASAVWTVGGEAVTAGAGGHYTTTVEPIPDGYIDQLLPTVAVGSASYTLGEGNVNWDTYHASVAWADSIVEMSLFDPGRIIGQNGGTVFTNFRPLSMTSGYKYNYGTMSFTNGGTTYHCRGVRQFVERPMAPLWVEQVTVPAISYSAEPVMYGQSLTLTVSRVATVDGKKTVGERICTMECFSWDILHLGQQSVSDGTVQMLTLVFKPEEELVLDEPFVIEIEGLQGDGVDVGLAAALIDDADRSLVEGASMLLQDATHHDIDATLSFPNRVPCISITALYDGIEMVSTGDALTLTAPREGGDCTAEGQSAVAKVQMKTAIRWDYGTDRANYTLEGLPDWLHATVDETKRDFNGSRYGNGLVTLTLKADAVPEGTPDREATIRVKGRGVTSAEPIVVRQQGYEPSGIAGVDAGRQSGHAPRRYSLDGRILPSTARGVVIEGGKKVVVR